MLRVNYTFHCFHCHSIVNSVLPEMATGRQSGDFWSFLGDKIFEIYLLNGDFSRENLLSDGDF